MDDINYVYMIPNEGGTDVKYSGQILSYNGGQGGRITNACRNGMGMRGAC